MDKDKRYFYTEMAFIFFTHTYYIKKKLTLNKKIVI